MFKLGIWEFTKVSKTRSVPLLLIGNPQIRLNELTVATQNPHNKIPYASGSMMLGIVLMPALF